jgi:four helix bundle protein
MAKLKSFRDLNVYQRLKVLHLEVHEETLHYPKFEMYELGSQVRRSSNSSVAIIAEGWGSRHTNIYIEAINRALGEIRETQHHIEVAKDKGYLTDERFFDLDSRYSECGKMLESLHQSLSKWKGTTRTGSVVREKPVTYESQSMQEAWNETLSLMLKAEENFTWIP